MVGGKYSNRVRATQYNPVGKVRRKANLQKKTFFVPELGKKVSLILSTRALRTMNKNGVYETMRKAGLVK